MAFSFFVNFTPLAPRPIKIAFTLIAHCHHSGTAASLIIIAHCAISLYTNYNCPLRHFGTAEKQEKSKEGTLALEQIVTEKRARLPPLATMTSIGEQRFPRTKRFDMEERKTLVFNAKARTIGVSASASRVRVESTVKSGIIFVVFDAGKGCILFF
jgi:hypothetical protein